MLGLLSILLCGQPAWAADCRPPPLRLDPLSLSRRTPLTMRAYRRALGRFLAWCEGHGVAVRSASELDDLLVEWRFQQQVPRAVFEHALAAAEMAVPAAKGALVWARATSKDLAVALPVAHHLPLPWQFALLLAVAFSVLGSPRLGLGLLLQQQRGLRPSEMLNLRGQDVALPEAMAFGPRSAAVINLGARTGTKAKRAQAVLVHEARHGLLLFVLRVLKACTPDEQFLFPATLDQYRRLLQQACERLNLPPFTPHSPRAGFASDAVLRGVDFVSLREEGRWVADSSLRVYLDAVATSAMAVSESAAALSGLLNEVEAAFVDTFLWWPASGLRAARPLPAALSALQPKPSILKRVRFALPCPPRAVCRST